VAPEYPPDRRGADAVAEFEVEGSTENATLVCHLLVGLRERGLDITRPLLVVIDGSKALPRAVRDVSDHPVIQRCQLHYADVRIMPISVGSVLVSRVLWANLVGIIQAPCGCSSPALAEKGIPDRVRRGARDRSTVDFAHPIYLRRSDGPREVVPKRAAVANLRPGPRW